MPKSKEWKLWVDPWDQRKREIYKPKIRKCLRCGKPMQSEWAGDRLHRDCRDTVNANAGGLDA